MTTAADTATIDIADIDKRITFDDAREIMEIDFDGVRLEDSAAVNAFYDRIEERIAETGQDKWFFLINYRNSHIDVDAWFSYARRGKALNMAHSQGSVRYDASDITRKQISRDAGTANFDPNLFADRESAIARLGTLPSQRVDRSHATATLTADDIRPRIRFDDAETVMEVDFSGVSFENSADVDLVYDIIDELIGPTGRKWYFLINYTDTRIQSGAWVQYAARGKRLNEEWSLGSVRFAPGSETETDIRLRAESQGFRPNIRNTRAEAAERIAEMKKEAAG